jgi:hypothetical protein
MYSEVLHYYVHNKTNATQTREGRARRILIGTKKKSHPHAKRGEGSCHHPGCVDGAASSSSSSPFPRPCHRRRVRYFSRSSLAFLLPVSTPRTVARDGGWGSGGGGGDGGDGHPRPRLPLVVVVLAQLEVLGHCLSLCFHPVSSCSQRQLAFVILSFHPRSILRTVASSGSGGHCFSPSFSSCSPLPPREQLLAAAVGGAVMVSARPVVHPVSRGSQRRCRRRVPSRISSAGGVAVRQGSYLVVIPLP